MEQIYQIPSRGSISSKERSEFWQKIIADQERSGLKMTKFCQKNQLSLSTFKQWKYQLQKEYKPTKPKKDNDRNCASRFIALQIDNNASVINENTPEPKTAIKIIFKNGHTIVIAERICKEILLSIILQMSGLPC